MRLDAILLVVVVAAGCQLNSIAPEPLHGSAPHLILIAPARGPEASADASLLAGAEAALRARGYAVMPLQLGFDLLRQHRLTAAAVGEDAAGLGRVEAAVGADAVLRVAATRFSYEQGHVLERASYALTWQLVSTSGGELWHFGLDGDYVRPLDDSPLQEPVRDDERRPQPIGVMRQRPFRSAAELAANLHRAAFARLPEAGR